MRIFFFYSFIYFLEGSNYWRYGYKTQNSYPRLRLITWRRPEVRFGRNIVKKKQHKNYQDEDKKSTINLKKKKLILRLRNLISKWFRWKTIKNDPVKISQNWKSHFTKLIVFLDLVQRLTQLTQSQDMCRSVSNAGLVRFKDIEKGWFSFQIRIESSSKIFSDQKSH